VGVIKECDSPEVDDPEVRGSLLEDLDVQDLVDLALLLLGLLVGAVNVKHFQTVDKAEILNALLRVLQFHSLL
jgi:hypothetical protein